MVKQRRGADRGHGGRPAATARRAASTDDPFEAWERYPSHEAEENVGYQKLAWYAAPFGDAAIGLLVLAAIINGLRRISRAIIRLLVR